MQLLCHPEDLIVVHNSDALGDKTIAMDCDGNLLFTLCGHIDEKHVAATYLAVANRAYADGFEHGERSYKAKVRALLID